jgi:ACT domain-containing protein
MTIREAARALNAEAVQDEFEDRDLEGAYTSDLLSDVMANAKEGGALITIQAHKNTVAVATLVNVSVIFVCNSRPIPEDMIQAARDEGIAIYRTAENQYAVSGKLYALLHKET